MVEFDDNTKGHHDSLPKNRSNIYKMSAAMDMYFSMNDSISFQDMLDIDIKSEIDSLVGGHNDLSGFNFSDLPALDMDDGNEIRWAMSNSNLCGSSLNLDSNFDETTVVNPNAVMPVLSLTQNLRSPSPTLKESHLTFSPSTIKITATGFASAESRNTFKRDLTEKLEQAVETKKSLTVMVKGATQQHKTTPSMAKAIAKGTNNNNSHKPTTLLSFRNVVARQMSSPITVAQINGLGTVKTVAPRKSNTNRNHPIDNGGQRAYPKPAYSYSCLIAMALKNSRTGSLPVSEIYNFMCRHFPYFKTAPSGWKNSVRHNLSLNKCFEKIEKPAVNGSQRKGCLWAMNPAKITKMDDEVQKWSRKDPTAIRKAMINPDHLEALERGELKFKSSYDESETFGDSCGSAEEGSEGSDSEVEEYSMINTTQLIDITCVKEEQEENDESDYEVSMYEDEVDIEEDKEIIRVKMALAQQELLEYDRNVSMKKRKLYLIQN